jgi:Zn-dependent metalloprotease
VPDVLRRKGGDGVVQYTAGLRYRKQPGTLNASFADVLALRL